MITYRTTVSSRAFREPQCDTSDTVVIEELENHIFGATLASGIYQAILRQEDYTEVVKVIKN
jgi:hypothetical protein